VKAEQGLRLQIGQKQTWSYRQLSISSAAISMTLMQEPASRPYDLTVCLCSAAPRMPSTSWHKVLTLTAHTMDVC
jgi:hypothetical protein